MMISFDLDGTLVDYSFADAVWLEGIPRLYAENRGISLSDAKARVKKEYNKVGMKQLEWYNIQYWLRKFGLDPDSWETLFDRYRHRINTYPEVHEVLQALRYRECSLAVVSNAARPFLETELQETGLAEYFDHVFSATSDFKQVKKTETLYQKVLKALDIKPSEMIHIGDDWHFDYLTPGRAGIRCYYLDRENEKSGKHIVNDLTEFLAQIS
ncbi:MAG: HAD family hydrolase [Desulfobacterales bacterium]|nr:HAD family hydrolase [Desulfobacterales bacterium]